MWLQDVEKAITELREKLCDFNFICLEKIIPNGNCILFKTTYHTCIKWSPDGTIEEMEV